MYLSPLIIEITFFSSITSGQEAASKRNSTFFLCVKEKYFSNMIYVLFYCKIMLHRPAFFFFLNDSKSNVTRMSNTREHEV